MELPYDRPRRDGDALVVPLASIAGFAGAVEALGATNVDAIARGCEGIQALVAYENDRSAVAAAAAGGSAHGNALFASEGDAAVAAVSACHVDAGRVEEFPFGVVALLRGRGRGRGCYFLHGDFGLEFVPVCDFGGSEWVWVDDALFAVVMGMGCCVCCVFVLDVVLWKNKSCDAACGSY